MAKESTIIVNQATAHNESLTKKNLISKMIQVGSSTLMSRILGLARELLMSRYLGVGEIADAFITAFKIPNSLRKIFAEGALSAACIPTFISVMKKESQKEAQKEASALMSLSFLFFEGILLTLCLLVFWQTEWVIRLIAPGWFLVPGAKIFHSTIPILGALFEWIAPAWYVEASLTAQIIHAIDFLHILIAFIIFLSCSALLAGALQSVNHFFVPAIGPVLLNIAFIGGLLACLKVGLSIQGLCYCILLGGFLQFVLHIIMYFKLRFSFAMPTTSTWVHFNAILKKFLPCLLSMSILELNLFMSTTLATYLPKGSISLLNYTNRFMGIPLGVLVGTFSTILLPYFSRVSIYAPRRLGVYLFEASKMVFWVTIPCTLIMSILAQKIFQTIFLSDKFSLMHVEQAGQLLTIFLSGLFFFSLYKILLNIYYALHDTKTPCYISVAVLGINYALCKLLTPFFEVHGLALAFVLTNIIHVSLFTLFLYRNFNLSLYIKPFLEFAAHASLQIMMVVGLFIILYQGGQFFIYHAMSDWYAHFLLNKFGFWLWVGPLCGLSIALLIKTRRLFNVELYFLD